MDTIQENSVRLFDLEEVDEQAFDELYQKISEYKQENADAVISPDSKLEARSWLMSYMKLEDEVKDLKEYLNILDQRYLQPSRDRIEQHQGAMDVLKRGLLQFLINAEEKKISFPELATVSKFSPPDKIIYPEDDKEKEFVEKLQKEGSDYITLKPQLDKRKIKEYYEQNQELPIQGLDVEKDRESVRVTRSKIRK